MKIANKFISLGTVAALAFVCWSPDTSAASHQGAKQTDRVKCYGVNRCKGHSVCATKANKCKGMNSCKGSGVKMMKADKCIKKGGSLTEMGAKVKKHSKQKKA